MLTSFTMVRGSSSLHRVGTKGLLNWSLFRRRGDLRSKFRRGRETRAEQGTGPRAERERERCGSGNVTVGTSKDIGCPSCDVD